LAYDNSYFLAVSRVEFCFVARKGKSLELFWRSA